MSDLLQTIIALRENPDRTISFAQAVLRLVRALVGEGSAHGVFQGSHEIVLAEAQGAELVHSSGQVASHVTNMRDTARELANREAVLERRLTELRLPQNLTIKVREVIKPLLRASREARGLMEETERRAAELARTNPTRLQGVRLGAGGLGTASGRTQQALVSSQLQAQAAQLRARGIDPSLVLRPDGSWQHYLARVRNLPLNRHDALAKLVTGGGALSAMRMALAQALTRTDAALRPLLRLSLAPLEVLLQWLTTLGSSLTSFLIVPKFVMDLILERSGLQPPSA